jgi:hypothetical protein
VPKHRRRSRLHPKITNLAVRNKRQTLSVPGSRFLVLSSWFSVLGSRFSVLSSRFSVPGSQFLVLGSWNTITHQYCLQRWSPGCCRALAVEPTGMKSTIAPHTAVGSGSTSLFPESINYYT